MLFSCLSSTCLPSISSISVQVLNNSVRGKPHSLAYITLVLALIFDRLVDTKGTTSWHKPSHTMQPDYASRDKVQPDYAHHQSISSDSLIGLLKSPTQTSYLFLALTRYLLKTCSASTTEYISYFKSSWAPYETRPYISLISTYISEGTPNWLSLGL